MNDLRKSEYEPALGQQRQERGEDGNLVMQEWRGKELGWLGVPAEDAFDLPVNDACIPPQPTAAQPYDKARLLDTAKATVSGRGKNYGKPEDNFARIALHWDTFLCNRYGSTPALTPGDVAVMMCLMKIARLENDPTHADSWIDLAGYAACGAEIETAK
jgi:hypothetical protein